MEIDKAMAFAPTQNALATPLSSHSCDGCLNVKAIYLFILKAFFVTGLLGWAFIGCPAVVADEFESLDDNTPNIEQPYATNLADTGWLTTGSAPYHAFQTPQNAGDYQSTDALHVGIKRLRQILTTWWARHPNQSSMTTKVKSMITATGDGPYAAWSYNIDASSAALVVNIRYEF